MTLKFTKRAIEKTTDIQTRHPEYQNLPLQIFLSGKGCDGYEYGVAFDEVLENDHVLDIAGIGVCVDSRDMPTLDGSTVDYFDNDQGEGFVVQNPNEEKFKRKYWKEQEGR